MTMHQEQDNQKNNRAQQVYQKLQRYRKRSLIERDYKAEPAEALERKYKLNIF